MPGRYGKDHGWRMPRSFTPTPWAPDAGTSTPDLLGNRAERRAAGLRGNKIDLRIPSTTEHLRKPSSEPEVFDGEPTGG